MKIAVVLTARPSYAKWKTVLEALREMPDVELQIVVAASALLERYGRVKDVLVADGHAIDAECWTVLEGENLVTSARETGIALMDLSAAYHRLQPDIVAVMADRHEILAAAAAAKIQHIRLAHVQSGERSGSVDDAIRDSVSHLADVYFPATERAKWRTYSLTGSQQIYLTGCPSIDLAKRALDDPPVRDAELGGTGPAMNLQKPFGIVLFHPVTNEADQAHAQMQQVLGALDIRLPWLCLWPGEDAGSGGISKAIREASQVQPLRTVRNLPPQRFLKLLTQCSVLAGNSSAGIRESSWLGVPVVDVGMRQYGRERASNVMWVPPVAEQIGQAIRQQVAHGPYPSSSLYGTGNSGQQIAEVLRRVCTRTDTSQATIHRLSGQKLAEPSQ